jgi:hypothetical protein
MSTADSKIFNGGGEMPALPAVPNHKDKESEEEALPAAVPNHKDKESKEEEDNDDEDCTPVLVNVVVNKANANDVILPWVIEGADELDEEKLRHMNVFYVIFKERYIQKNYTCVLFTKAKHQKILNYCLDLIDGADCQEQYLQGNKQAYKWQDKYDAVTVGDSSILVRRPEGGAIANAQALNLSSLIKPLYVERAFIDILAIHIINHCKSTTLLKCVADWHGNIPQEVCKMFTDCCPTCIAVLSRKKPVAGIRNIVTHGFGVCGQVDLIDFQSMADGVFKFLLNYIDHGIKKLNSIPLFAKRASCIAVALFTIFTEQGPPTILQTDNGGEFSQSAENHTKRLMKLDNAFVNLVIKELKHLWPECHLVQGLPRHSESNGGVECINQTVKKKLGAWMKENNTKHWAIGCRMVQWR